MSAWTAFFWGDYLRDTQDLDLMQHGAYFKLLAHYYSTGGPIPADKKALFRICGAFSKDEQNAVLSVSRRFFTRNEETLCHRRADEELAKRVEIAKSRSEAGKKGTAKRYGKGKIHEFPSR